ncbi:Regulating synaptic membrane exocytosis protein 4 [Liparis tanakae]|uniref:Regulating synaptic membrane exocytosis protein 4 n=1 Tax=Liparis tanakae TaxID=230148 RepID=A0A4Z2E6B7_9TELE|nr:Regulating synaptic membrane exocytosis protein 4 [Liparis tanakae]
MQRSQSRVSLSASFEALAIYFPCVNSFDEDDGGEWPRRAHRAARVRRLCIELFWG